MSQKILTLLFGVAMVALLTAGKNDGETILKSSGSHISSTGAPGEQTCAKAGCHADANIVRDDNKVVTSLTLGNNDKTYIPSKQYSISLKAVREGTGRFGFQVVALDTNNRSIGTFTVPQGSKLVQLQKGAINGADRNYVTHTTSGNSPMVTGEIDWRFNWTSPQSYKGKVTFYYCVNATNMDNQNTGDNLYVASESFNTSLSDVEEHDWISREINVYPTIANNYLTIENLNGFKTSASYRVVSLSGATLLQSDIPEHSHSVAIPLETIPNGCYILLASSRGSRIAKQFVVVK